MATMSIYERVVCSSISFRQRSLPGVLETISDHAHLPDPVRDDFHYSIDNRAVDFDATPAALEPSGYQGLYSLGLETRNVTDDQPPTAARAAGERISSILTTLEPAA